MKFNICIGNPPYGVRKKGSTADLHYKIFKTSLGVCSDKLSFIMPSKPITQQLEDKWYNVFKSAVCTDIVTIDKTIFPNTVQDNTAIYYCDRTIPEDEIEEKYCKDLDVDDKIYDAISEEGKLVIDKLGKFNSVTIFRSYDLSYKDDAEKTKKQIETWCNDLNDGKYYLNVNRFGIKPGEGIQIWLSGELIKEDVKTKDEEILFYKTHTKKKNIIECPNKKYGENLKNMLINSLVFRYGLWLTQTNQAIYQAQYKYVPDIDYTTIDTDEKLLSECGFSDNEIEKVMNYLKDFDFTQNRNVMVRNAGVKSEPDSSPSSSETSKPVVDDEDEETQEELRRQNMLDRNNDEEDVRKKKSDSAKLAWEKRRTHK